jgi:hypothetical protein
MRESTARWLDPMLAEAEWRPVDVGALMYQASMPAREVDWTAEGKIDLAPCLPDDPGIEHRATDWIRFGQLLRAALGWDHYPDVPAP